MAVETNLKKEQANDNNISLQGVLMIGLKKWPWLPATATATDTVRVTATTATLTPKSNRLSLA
ncbi:MAG: hypothetical protein ACI30N_02730 [Muribaculaceae bacterium]